MIDWIFSSAVACYAIASALLFAYLAGGLKRRAGIAIWLLSAALVLHAAHDALRWYTFGLGPFAVIPASFSTLGILVVAAFLVIRRFRSGVDVVGAFVTPMALLLLLGSRSSSHNTVEHGSWIAVHIASNMLGMAALTVACAMAVAYLLQERQVKSRHLGTLFHRLPPLEVLDQLAFRCLVVGLPALTVGVITGHVVAARNPHNAGLPWQQYFAMIAWALFAAVLVLRLAAGWRGRRAAIGTILGYSSAILVLLFYSVRGAVA